MEHSERVYPSLPNLQTEMRAWEKLTNHLPFPPKTGVEDHLLCAGVHACACVCISPFCELRFSK